MSAAAAERSHEPILSELQSLSYRTPDLATVLDMLRTLRAGSAASGAKASSFNLGAAIAASLTWDSHFAQVPGLLAARLISYNVTHAAISAEAPMPCSRDFNELVRGI